MHKQNYTVNYVLYAYGVSLSTPITSSLFVTLFLFFCTHNLLTTSFFAADKPTIQQLIKIKKKDGNYLCIIGMFAAHHKHQLEDFAKNAS